MQGKPGGLHHCEPRDGAHPVLPPVQRPVLLLPHRCQFTLSHCCKRWTNCIFVKGANPGFHEGVADILSLAVGTAEYFQVPHLGLTCAIVILSKNYKKFFSRIAQDASTFLYWSRKFSPKSSLKQNWLNAILRSFTAGTISISCSYLS